MKLLWVSWTSLKILLCLSLLPSLLRPAVALAPTQRVLSSRHSLKYQVLPIPLLAAGYGWETSGAVSPDGRWLAYSDAFSAKRDVLVVYDLTRRKVWRVNMGRQNPDQSGANLLAWRQDSQACAVGATGGWAVVWPGRRRWRWISHLTPGGEGCAAWSPRTHRLAMFEGFFSGGKYRVWDGHHLSAAIGWAKAVKYPYGEERAWQCAWSPNEKSIFLRFYGHAERDSYAAGHLVVINPRTCAPQFLWGAEAGPAAWLDNSRLAYRDDDDGIGGEVSLMVAKPRASVENAWLPHVDNWTLNTRQDTFWALTASGQLFSSATRHRAWHLIASAVTPRKTPVGDYAPTITLSPRGDMIAVWNMWGGHGLSLISTNPAHPWQQSWQTAHSKIKVLGWAKGQTLPLLEVSRSANAPAEVWQLTR